MRVAGASVDNIAYLLEMSAGAINHTIKRVRVANYILLLNGIASEGLEEGILDLNDAIKSAATEAFDLEIKNMRELDLIGDLNNEHIETRDIIKAKLGAVATAQDILDRAGKRAPTKVLSTSLHGHIPDAALERLAKVAKELSE